MVKSLIFLKFDILISVFQCTDTLYYLYTLYYIKFVINFLVLYNQANTYFVHFNSEENPYFTRNAPNMWD